MYVTNPAYLVAANVQAVGWLIVYVPTVNFCLLGGRKEKNT